MASSELAREFTIQIIDSESQEELLSIEDGVQASSSKLSSKRRFKFENREFILEIHPRISPHQLVSFLAPVAIAILLATLATFSLVWWTENNASKQRLEELNQILRLTIYDTSNSLTAIKGYLEMMKDDPEMVRVEKLSKHVSFIIDLLDQIKVMKKLSGATQDWKLSEHTLLQIILEVSDILSDRLKAKSSLLQPRATGRGEASGES